MIWEVLATRFGATWRYVELCWAILAPFLVILGVLGSMLGHVGGKMRQDSDQEHQVEPNMGGWRLPDGRVALGWRVNVPLWGPTQTQRSSASLLQASKTLIF